MTKRLLLRRFLTIGVSFFMLTVFYKPALADRDLASHPVILTPDIYKNPPNSLRPKFRWWWPGAEVDLNEITREINQIADAGFGGVEIADVHLTATLSGPENFWGTPKWNAAIETALKAAKARGLKVDLTIGPLWPSIVPGVTADSEAVSRELAYGQAIVNAAETYTGPVPAPVYAPNPAVLTKQLIGVQAARCSTGYTGQLPVQLDASSLIDLTNSVDGNGIITWTAPAQGQWLIISLWQRGTGQKTVGIRQLTTPDGYAVDHFGRAGAQAVVDYWKSNLLTPSITNLLRQNGVAIFEDSLELLAGILWTPSMLQEFQQRRGYSLVKYLPLLAMQPSGSPYVKGTPVFAFAGDISTRVRHDYDQTLSDLYLENRVKPLQAAINAVGLEFRAQPYGAAIDPALAAATLDIPEGESLGFTNPDSFRLLAAGRDMGARRILSDEIGAVLNGAFRTTWHQMLSTINANYAAGVNQMVLHGFSYATAPRATWPGFAAFYPLGTVDFAEAWGPRQPTWAHVNGIGSYMGRTQAVLQNGTSRVDVAIYRQEFDPAGAPFFADQGLARAGFSYGFMSHGVLDLPSATVKSRRLAPNGPAYQALVLNNQSSIPLETAQKILGYAQAGLPIVVVGTTPVSTPGYFDAVAQDAALKAVIAKLLAQPGVRRVATEAGVPGALQAVGVRPAAENTQPADILNVHRADGAADYFYFYNPGTEAADVTVSLAAKGQPFELDTWTGGINPIALYSRKADRTELRVQLAPEETTIIAIPNGNRFNLNPPGLNVTSSEASVQFDLRGRLVARATVPGKYAVTLSNRHNIDVSIPDVPATQTLSSWHLGVEDWQPGASATETVKIPHSLDLNALLPWMQVPGFQDVSGIGRYTTSVTLDRSWTGGYGAYLKLGEVSDTFKVTVNGQTLPPVDLANPLIDIGPYLKAGRNTIGVEVATTLNNRMRLVNPNILGGRPRQPYGLIGPVQLIPYGEVSVWPGK